MAQPRPDEPRQAAETRETVGAFANAEALDRAVQELLGAGFLLSDISLLASDETVEDKLGHRLTDTRALEDDPEAPRRSWTSPEARTEGKSAAAGVLGYIGAVVTAGVTFATGGTALAAAALGILAGGATAAAGLRLANAIDAPLAESLSHQIDKGGILLWVAVTDDAKAAQATAILRRHGAEDVHTHRIIM